MGVPVTTNAIAVLANDLASQQCRAGRSDTPGFRRTGPLRWYAKQTDLQWFHWTSAPGIAK